MPAAQIGAPKIDVSFSASSLEFDGDSKSESMMPKSFIVEIVRAKTESKVIGFSVTRLSLSNTIEALVESLETPSVGAISFAIGDSSIGDSTIDSAGDSGNVESTGAETNGSESVEGAAVVVDVELVVGGGDADVVGALLEVDGTVDVVVGGSVLVVGVVRFSTTGNVAFIASIGGSARAS